MKYLVVLEKADSGFGAWVPDLPGCIAAGSTESEVLALMKEAIEFHLEGLREQGEAIPLASSCATVLEVDAA